MRIRRMAEFLARKQQLDAPPPQQIEEDTTRDEKNEKVVVDTVAVEDDHMEAKPIGNVVRVSGEGLTKRNHFASFEYNGAQYDIEDFAMFFPDREDKRPYVAIIKDLAQTGDGSMMITVQWFYRPEDTEKRGGGNWESSDSRELFYSFHQDEISAESVMHQCVVHFVPLEKQLPCRKQHPGFIVQKVYDTDRKRLFKFTDRVYVKCKKAEIDLLIQRTLSRIGELPDIDKKVKVKKKRLLKKE